jgi:hypothetical protein
MSKRIPILPPFSHDGLPPWDLAPYDAPVSDIFELTGVSEHLGLPILEMHELKSTRDTRPALRSAQCDDTTLCPDRQLATDIAPQSPAKDELGCWSFWATWGLRAPTGMGQDSFGDVGESQECSPIFTRLSHAADVHLTPLPDHIWTRDDRFSASFSLLASHLSQPELTELSPIDQYILDDNDLPLPSILPSSHFACLDTLFFVQDQPAKNYTGDEGYEEWADLETSHGAWHTVAKYMRFREPVVEFSMEWLGQHMGLKHGDPIPSVSRSTCHPKFQRS